VRVCGGCRARAYEATGDYLQEEPLCLYQPQGKQGPQKDDQMGS
jgi:MoaA/NifB/PqqE/SkfB family radical SAM enzyme